MRKYVSITLVCLGLFLVGSAVYGATYGINFRAADFETDDNDCLLISNANQTGLGITGDLTILAWIRPENPTGGSKGIVAKFRTPGDLHSYDFSQRLNESPPNFTFQLYDGTTNNDVDFKVEGVVAEVWIHVAVVYDASAGAADFYLNASTTEEMQITGLVTSIQNSTSDFNVGSTQNCLTDWYDGDIDDVRIYNRALSANEIRSIYTKFGQSGGVQEGLVGYWYMNEASGTRVDQTNNGNDLSESGTGGVDEVTDVAFEGGGPIGI